MTLTPNLGLTTFSTASGSAVKFEDFRAAIAGDTSNMTILDYYYGTLATAITSIRSNAVYLVNGIQITTNNYVATVSSLTSYTTGMVISFKADTGNGTEGLVTLNINSLGAKEMKNVDINGGLIDIHVNFLIPNRYYSFIYNGVEFVIINTLSDETFVLGGTTNFTMIGEAGILTDSTVPVITTVIPAIYNAVDVDQYGRVISGSLVTAGHVIKDANAGLDQRSNLTLIGGGFRVYDDVGNDQTIVKVTTTQSELTGVATGGFVDTWVNQSTSTCTDMRDIDRGDGFVISNPGGLVGLSGVTKVIPNSGATSSECIFCIDILSLSNAPRGGFIGWLNSSTGSFAGLIIALDGSFQYINYTDAFTIDSFLDPISSFRLAFLNSLWIKLNYIVDGNRTISIGHDGRNWVDFNTVAFDDFISPDKVIAGIFNPSSLEYDDYELKLLVYSYTEKEV